MTIKTAVEMLQDSIAPHSLYKSPAGYSAMMEWYDVALRGVAVPYESLTVATSYGNTHILALGPGDAPPVILVHGTNGNAIMWKKQFPDLAQEFRIYALDNIGSAGKSSPVRPDYRGQGYAQWLMEVLDALQIEQASWVGVSGGTWMILKLATLASQRIARAILMSANGFVPIRFPGNLYQFGPMRAVMDALNHRLITSPERARELLGRFSPPDVTMDDEMATLFYLLTNHFKNQPPAPPLSELEQRMLNAPTLLLMGEYENNFKPDAVIRQARKVLSGLRSAEIVQGVGHGMTDERPDVVNPRLLDFLEEG